MKVLPFFHTWHLGIFVGLGHSVVLGMVCRTRAVFVGLDFCRMVMSARTFCRAGDIL